jgi:hypothetical protein
MLEWIERRWPTARQSSLPCRAENAADFQRQTLWQEFEEVEGWLGIRSSFACRDSHLLVASLLRLSATATVASFACIHERRMVDTRFSRWNRIDLWLRHIRTLETLVQGSN